MSKLIHNTIKVFFSSYLYCITKLINIFYIMFDALWSLDFLEILRDHVIQYRVVVSIKNDKRSKLNEGIGEKVEKDMMPLALADSGEENIIRKIGGSPEVKKHLEDLGFVVGDTVTVVTTLNGNVIVKVKEARVAISEEMARKIMV